MGLVACKGMIPKVCMYVFPNVYVLVDLAGLPCVTASMGSLQL